MRSSIGGAGYWNARISKDGEWIAKARKLLEGKSDNPTYDPQFTFDLSKDTLRMLLRCYSRGDVLSELAPLFPNILEMWELSNRLAVEVCDKQGLATCRNWVFDLSNLNHYQWCFGLIGLALALEVPDVHWQRLLALVGQEGEDVLLDKVVACRQSGRRIGSALLHDRPYGRLLTCLELGGDQQARLLRDFLDHWYPELARTGKQRLWWYDYGDPVKHPLEKGSYFGRWCIEAVAAVKSFGIDDTDCLDHPYYPGDLVQDGRSPRYSDSVPATGTDMSQIEFGSATHGRPARNWLSRLLLGPDRRR